MFSQKKKNGEHKWPDQATRSEIRRRSPPQSAVAETKENPATRRDPAGTCRPIERKCGDGTNVAAEIARAMNRTVMVGSPGLCPRIATQY